MSEQLNNSFEGQGWARVQLHQVLAEDLMNGRSVPTAEQGFPVLRLTALGDGRIDLRERKTGQWTRDDAEKYLVREGDFLIARGNGSIRLVGRGGLVAENAEVAFPDTMIRARPSAEVIAPNFLRYQWDCPTIRSQIECAAKTTAGIYKVNQGDLRGVEVVLAPLPEQHRIVAEIEKQFTRLDAAVATLEKVQVKLQAARASVLKAAVEGRLVPTEAELARAEGRSYELADVLLERILAERKAKAGKGRYTPPVEPDTEGLPELPEGWVWASVEQTSDPIRTVTYGVVKLGDETDHGVPTLRSSNVRPLRLETDFVKRISPQIEANYRRTRLVGGEVLITVRGTLGGVVVAPPSCAGWNVSREVAVIALQAATVGPFMSLAFASPVVSNWISRRLKGITYTGLNIATLKQVPVPLPPLPEQTRIVAEVERRLSVLDALGQTVETNLRRLTRLRQSILKRAFEGKLVPHDPNDEPASALLARIQSQVSRAV